MKALKIDCEIYCFPSEIGSIEDLIAFLHQNYHQFVPFTRYVQEHCVEPFFIQEDTETVYLNVAHIDEISETEITVLPRMEFNRRLREATKRKCLHCQEYLSSCDPDDIESYADKLSLDGRCDYFEEDDFDEDD